MEKGFEITGGELELNGLLEGAGLSILFTESILQPEFQIEEPDREYAVRFKEWNGTTAEVHVNGEKAGQICWPPYELNVGHLVRKRETMRSP